MLLYGSVFPAIKLAGMITPEKRLKRLEANVDASRRELLKFACFSCIIMRHNAQKEKVMDAKSRKHLSDTADNLERMANELRQEQIEPENLRLFGRALEITSAGLQAVANRIEIETA